HVYRDGARTVGKAHGEQEIETAYSVVYKDREGHVIETLDEGAKPQTGRSFEYDAEGELIHVNNRDGSSIRKAGEPPVWREYDKDGNATPATYDYVEVTAHGSLVTEKYGQTSFNYPDGSQKVHKDDSVVYMDREGRVMQTADKHEQPASKRSFEYDAEGELIHVNNPDGSSIRKGGEPPVWRDYDRDGNVTPKTHDEVDVTEFGTLVTEIDGETTLNHPDVSQDVHTDDSLVQKDREGRVTLTVNKHDSSDRSFEYDAEGGLIHVNNPDGSSIRKAG